jgi:hypothetical protein
VFPQLVLEDPPIGAIAVGSPTPDSATSECYSGGAGGVVDVARGAFQGECISVRCDFDDSDE